MTEIVKEIVFDIIIREPEQFAQALSDIIDVVFDAAQYLSNHGQPGPAIQITNELCLTSRVNEWQGANDE